jgi:hypothetical protein
MKVHMLPVAMVFDTFPRVVRDLCKELSKVLEEIKDPLMHLLCNAVDHGIASLQKRIGAGKPRRETVTTVTLSAFPKGISIVIEVADDGADINADKVKKAVLKSGMIKGNLANVGSVPARALAQQPETLGTQVGNFGALSPAVRLAGKVQRLTKFLAQPGWARALAQVNEVGYA